MYNEPYLPNLLNKHPKALGAPFREIWPELYGKSNSVEVLVELWSAAETGVGIRQNKQLYHTRLNDGLEEKYFNIGMLVSILNQCNFDLLNRHVAILGRSRQRPRPLLLTHMRH